MCNFYIMYYIDGDATLTDHYCFTPGPPSWSWNDFGGLDTVLAPLSASIDPLNDQFLAATGPLIDQSVDDQLAHLLASLQAGHDVDDYVMRYGAAPYDDVNDDDDLYERITNYID